MSEDPFDGSPVSRRRFMALSAATGAALTLPANATADASSPAFTTEYQYVLNHTPEDHAVPTLVRFSDPSGTTAMEGALDKEVHTTTSPEPAGYAQVTTAEAQMLADLPNASEFQFAPGSNPFWRIGYYPMGVFPEPRRSVDYIGFEQLKDGLNVLEERYPDKIRVKRVGQSPGHHNNVTDRPDPKGMYVAELTNFDSETDFEDKEKVFFSCSLHGLEMAGRETGARVLENAARGSEPDVDGSDAKLEPLLDDVVVIIGFTNPDGWAVRNPQYDSGWQVGGPGTGTPRAPAAPLYERGNAEVFDTNRQYPAVGYINPAHYPAAPANYEGDEPGFVNEKVPDAKAFVDYFQDYENLNYGADLHGGPVFNNFVLGLISQDQFNTRELHEVYEMCRNINETLASALSTWETVGQARVDLVGDQQFSPVLFGVVPESAFDYATIYDTIGYTVSGAFLDWMAHPEPIGLDMTTLDFEMSFNHMLGGNVYNPELFEMEVTGYRAAIRTITQFAVNNTDTPTTDEEFSTETKTSGDTVAYITTGEVGSSEDALRRTDGQLDFDYEGTEFYETSEEGELAADLTEFTFDVERTDIHSMGVHLHGEGIVADLDLVSPSGETVYEFEGVTDERVGGKCCGLPEFTVSDPEPGTWSLQIANYQDAGQIVEMQRWTLAAQGAPDPTQAWGSEGYEQAPYDVTPFEFFKDYESAEKRGNLRNFIRDGGSVEPVTVDEVRSGKLADENYDHAVLIHDYVSPKKRISGGTDNQMGDITGNASGDVVDDYTDALDDFVDSGGNLVVTDTGTYVLPELDNELLDGSKINRESDVERQFLDVARFTSKNLDHPLFDKHVREIQNQLWKVQPLGYQVTGEAPMDLVSEAAFTGAATDDGVASIAGRTNSLVAAGSITEAEDSGRGIHYISSLLPPAWQANLHPFGLQNYTVTFLGNILLTSALGFEQVRTAGDTKRRYGRTDGWNVGGSDPTDDLTASGSRTVDSSVVTGEQAHRVELTVSNLSEDAVIRDQFPDGWDLLPWAQGTEVDDGVVEFRYSDDSRAVPADEVDGGDESVTFTYFVEPPGGVQNSNVASYGPAIAKVGEETANFAGQDDVVFVGVDT
ncbi:hypothetical protein HWV23_13420 [Natronomonas halophila]|uniref:M14 family metallopeptidase n=1 Tax=Natronomonas halophila TaxID=2747817 RepID=UPI0015B3A53B|nr:M14 family metallopeptidase [Natronomonas halophila]QLD86685.1 hypothetical protein HWV23_13420 [Natronomonas halophila]